MINKKVVKTSEIHIRVGQNAEQLPVIMDWSTTDNPLGSSPQECKAMLLSFFDKKTKDTLKIDLWTTDMQVVEMDRFFFQTLRALTDTYKRATQNKELAGEMERFVQFFGERTQIIPKEK